MKELAVVLLALALARGMIHRRSLGRTREQQRAWADWFALHPDGGGA